MVVFVDVKVKFTKDGIFIPEDLFREMMDAYFRMEQVLATIDILADDEALKVNMMSV